MLGILASAGDAGVRASQAELALFAACAALVVRAVWSCGSQVRKEWRSPMAERCRRQAGVPVAPAVTRAVRASHHERWCR